MKKLIVSVIAFMLVLSGCAQTPKTLIDWVDFVKLNEISYLATPFKVNEDQIEFEVGKTKFKVSESVHDPNYKTKDGDAAFLPIGTPIYKLKNYKTEYRVVARKENQFMIYEVSYNPKARRGSDLFDIQDKVTSVSILDGEDNSKIGEIKDQGVIDELVSNLLFNSSIELKDKEKKGPRYFLTFNLKDQTNMNRAYWPEENMLWGGIKLPNEFKDIITQNISGYVQEQSK